MEFGLAYGNTAWAKNLKRGFGYGWCFGCIRVYYWAQNGVDWCLGSEKQSLSADAYKMFIARDCVDVVRRVVVEAERR